MHMGIVCLGNSIFRIRRSFPFEYVCLIPMWGPRKISNKVAIRANQIQIMWTTLYIYIYKRIYLRVCQSVCLHH